MTELEDFVNRWNQEAEKTLTLLRALPTDAYEFRPEPGGRSIGELAWHLAEIDALVKVSKLVPKYNTAVDNESAYEILTEKITQATQRTQEATQQQAAEKTTTKRAAPKEESWLDNPIVRSAGRTAATMLTRSLLGVLGLGGTTRRRSSRSLF